MATKYRWFAFLVYPESAPADWWELCRGMHAQFCRSPLHSADAENAKPHYHVMYRHANTVTEDYASRLLVGKLGAVVANGHVETVVHPDVYMRYLVHMDDGEKEQFEGNPFDLCECLGGFPLDFTKEYTPQDRREQRQACFRLIRDNGITEYSDLIDGLLDEGYYDLFDFACTHSILFSHYLASARGRVRIDSCSTADNRSYVK